MKKITMLSMEAGAIKSNGALAAIRNGGCLSLENAPRFLQIKIVSMNEIYSDM